MHGDPHPTRRFASFGEFNRWNERMFTRFHMDKLYYSSPNPILRWMECHRVRRACGLLAAAAGERILDLGSGTGYLMSQIGAGTVVGLDLSREAMRIAAGKFRGDPARRLIRGDAMRLPFEDGVFDKAICSEVIEHTTHPRALVSELMRVVRPGGRVVLTLPNERLINLLKTVLLVSGVFDLLFPGISRRMQDEWHLHEFDLAVLYRVIRQVAIIENVWAIPIRGVPIRYMVILRQPRPGHRSS